MFFFLFHSFGFLGALLASTPNALKVMLKVFWMVVQIVMMIATMTVKIPI